MTGTHGRGVGFGGGKIDQVRYIGYCGNHKAESICSTQGRINNDRQDLSPQVDPRIRAWVLIAPVSLMFSPDSLKTLTAPLLIFTGDKDEELSWWQNAAALAETLPKKPELKVIPNAGHFVFLSSCSLQMHAIAWAFCDDAPSIDRITVYQRLNDDISDFLKDVWQ